MRVYTTIILILSFVSARSQSAQIGVGVVDLNTAHQILKSPDTTNIGKTKSTLNFKPVLTFNFFNKKNIDYSLQGGYFHERYINTTKSTAIDKSIVVHQINKTNRNSVYVKLGVGRRVDYKKFYLSYGLQVPLMVNFYNYTANTSVSQDSIGNFIQSITTTNNLPNSYSAGLLLNVGSFYKLWKNLYVGGEFQYGLYYALQYGKRTFTQSNAYSSSPSICISQVLNYNNSSFQLVVIPTIHIRYTLLNKKGEDAKPVKE